MTQQITVRQQLFRLRAQPIGNVDDTAYGRFLARIYQRFWTLTRGGQEPVFATQVPNIWRTYLKSFPLLERQYHDCSACRHFLERYGHLVVIDAQGRTTPLFWNDRDDYEPRAMQALHRAVSTAPVAGVFLSAESTWGIPRTGRWVHFGLAVPPSMVYQRTTQTAAQKMAERQQDHETVMRALGEFSLVQLDQVVALLESDALYRAERVLGPATWLRDLKKSIRGQPSGSTTNMVWRAIATAPAGYCHPRSSMIGTLLDDLAAGMSFDTVASRFAARMHPLSYQRPQAAPSAGNIAQAEKIVAELGAKGSLARRLATVDEIEAVWRPRAPEGVFSHLRSSPGIPTLWITWSKLAREVLPAAGRIEVKVPSSGNFAALVTAVNPAAPPILQWDREERRNQASWYVYASGSRASDWSLMADTWTEVTAVALQPSQWFDAQYPHHGEGVFFLLRGARDRRYARAGAGLFPEILRSELHGVRATIEAYSRRAVLLDTPGELASGIKLSRGATAPVLFRVTPRDYPWMEREYVLDRWG